MRVSSEDSCAVPLPLAEKPARWPQWGVWALALGRTGWLLTEAAPQVPPNAVLWSRERVALVVLAPEVAAYLAGASVLLVFGLARRFGGAWVAGLAAGIFALVASLAPPVPLAQTVTMFLILAAAWLVLRFVDDPAPGVGMLAGLCLGLIPAFSRTGTVGALALVGWLLWSTVRSARAWSVGVGAMGPLAWLAATRAAPWVEHWREFFHAAGRHLRNWPDYFGGIVWPDARAALWWSVVFLGMAGAGVLLLNRRRRNEGLLLVGVMVAMAVCHAVGSGSVNLGGFWIMPLPFLVVGAAGLWARVMASRALPGRIAVAAVVLVQLGLGVAVFSGVRQRERAVARAAAEVRTFAERTIAPGGFIVGPATLARALAAGGQWHFIDSRLLAGFGRSEGARRGPWRRPDAATRAHHLDELRAQAAGGPVYLFTRATDPMLRALRGRASVEVVAEIKAPLPVRRTPPAGNERSRRSGQSTREAAPAAEQTLQVVKIVFAAE